MMRFLTPNTTQLTGSSVRRFFCVDAGVAHFLTGALDELTSVENWEPFGDATVQQMVELFEEVIASMENCENIGQVLAFFGKVPSNCLVLDGKVYPVSDYPLLADEMPIWVVGDDIHLPALTDSYLVGADSSDVSLFTGSNTHTLTEDEMPRHTHEYTTAVGSVSTVVVPDEPSAVPAPATTLPAGGGMPHNNMPYSIGVYWAVVAK